MTNAVDPQDALARYAFALDQHDLAALENVLTEDAVWEFEIAGSDGVGPVSGRAAILEFVRSATAAQTDQRRHYLSNLIISSTDGEAAEVHVYLMLTSDEGGRPHVITTGTYEFGLRRVEGGWRIGKLHLRLDKAA